MNKEIKEYKVLTTLPNIGKVLADKLKHAGIDTFEKLQSIGSENTYKRLHIPRVPAIVKCNRLFLRRKGK
jgi:hypothetical protein